MNNKLINLSYLVIDVDGTMTDGGIYYDENGNEYKKFSTKDAAGFFAAKYAGIKIIVITGRECKATTRRMQELKVEYFFQNIKNKYEFLDNFMHMHDIRKSQLGYIGDDLNDLEAMRLAMFVGAPNDSCNEILNRSDYISRICGGYGAVRDVIEHILSERGQWEDITKKIYSGI